jgi:hypothetical protein
MIGHSRAMRTLFKARSRRSPHERARADHGRERHGQRARRARDPPRRAPARRRPLREGQLRGDPRGAHRERALRLRARRVHGREPAQEGHVRARERRHALPRRDRRHERSSAQAKVLRALQSGEITRVGSEQSIAVDVRILAATNRLLEEDVAEGRFREDLFFRLNVLPLHTPPLRDRREDIPVLVQAFLRDFCKENGFKEKALDPDVLDALSERPWPGNVRELRNASHRRPLRSAVSSWARQPSCVRPRTPPA